MELESGPPSLDRLPCFSAVFFHSLSKPTPQNTADLPTDRVSATETLSKTCWGTPLTHSSPSQPHKMTESLQLQQTHLILSKDCCCKYPDTQLTKPTPQVSATATDPPHSFIYPATQLSKPTESPPLQQTRPTLSKACC